MVDFHVEAEENVMPMVPAGKSLHEMEGLRALEECDVTAPRMPPGLTRTSAAFGRR